ncbi:hypothetical protein O988_03169 [Pseudogymnoascus sp. VKM F-3808]|nr:hypothetical protein O988_03169 [Pseudogymnoascus sp. VKM F-3808]
MASAVYEGVAGGGDLFQGQRFFIVQKVPLRNTLIEDVKVNMPLSRMAAATNFMKRNGGLVVPLEKNADVLIADHAKPKLAPVNSVSWTYLEQSMKKGQLEDLETHRINSSGKTGLSGGLSPPKKSTRTPFTHEDDTAISIWVAKAERLGLSVKGNEIYEQFADKNPRHTAQSWRDHWIKQLSSQPRPEINMDSTDWPVKNKEDRPRRAFPPAIQSKNVVTTPNASGARKPHMVPPATPHSLEGEIPISEEPPFTTDVPFTDEDIAVLEDEYCDIVKVPQGKIVHAWEAFAKVYTRHTAGDWCNYYYNTFAPRKCEEGEDEDATAINPKPNWEPDSTSRAYTTPIRAAASSISESRDTASHRKVGEDGAITNRLQESEPPMDQSQTGPAADKAKFLGNLGLLSSIIKYEFEPYFSIYGLKLELYDLWSVVNKPEFGGFRKVDGASRWLQVATKLGINTYKHETAHTALKQVYRDRLIDFDTYISGGTVREKKRRASPTMAKEPVTPVTVIPTQAPEQAHSYSSARKDGKTKGRVSLPKFTEPVTPGAAIPAQTPRQARLLSSGVSTPKTLRPATVIPERSANKDTASQKIGQSVGHGELAFLQSLTEFAREHISEPVVFQPIVSRRKISLFSVWTASLPLLGHFEEIENIRDVWDDLATKLGFEISTHPSAPDELRQICDDFLVDYYEYYIMVEQEKVKGQALRQQSEDDGQSEEEAAGGIDDNLASPSLVFRTAVPERQKRSHDHDQHSISPVVESSPTSSHSHNKRPRISKGKERADEIPSTPEHVYNSHLNSSEKLPNQQNAKGTKLVETNIEYFPPPSPLDELDSSPSRQLWSETRDYTPPSQNNRDEEATQSQTDSQCNEKIGELCEQLMADGIDMGVIRQMMRITTMDAELTKRLISDRAKGLEVPRNVAGIWTEEDDNGVKSRVQSRDYKRTLEKHGEARCLQRKTFLRDYEELEKQEAVKMLQTEDA